MDLDIGFVELDISNGSILHNASMERVALRPDLGPVLERFLMSTSILAISMTD